MPVHLHPVLDGFVEDMGQLPQPFGGMQEIKASAARVGQIAGTHFIYILSALGKPSWGVPHGRRVTPVAE